MESKNKQAGMPSGQSIAEVFRSFIRMHHLTSKWEKFIDDNKIDLSALQKSEAEVEEEIDIEEEIFDFLKHFEMKCPTFIDKDFIRNEAQELCRLLSAPSKQFTDEEIVDIAFEFGYGCDPSKGNKQTEAIHDAFVAGMKKYRELAPSKGKYSEEDLLEAFAGGIKYQHEWPNVKIPFGSSPFNEWFKKFTEAPESSNTKE